uniref:Protein STE5 n=3 Tax=Lygus hesperus TaxID=30085 RepID=A0A0A9X5E3_LYGHE
MEQHLDRIAELAKNGTFGTGKFLQVIPNPDCSAGPQFASQLGFLAVDLEEDSNIVRKSIVVKIQPKEQAERDLQCSDNQFFVELTMYREVLPFLGALEMDVFPEFIYGEASRGADPDNDIVIMADLSGQGYIISPDIYLDADTFKLTLRRLGEFHGYSYRAKRSRPSETQTLGQKLPHKRFQMDDSEDMSRPIWDRGFNAAKKQCDSSQLLDKVRAKMDTYRTDELWGVFRKPKEPFAAFIHGDFNRNNLLFKYVDDKAVNVKFLDFQASIYSDPSVDLAFFLYMNSTQETRDNHWEDFFKTYWEGVVSIEPKPGFSYDEFLKHFASRALYGYLPCSFFLPMMLDTEKAVLAEFLTWTYEQKLHRMTTTAGEVGDKAIADIVLDLLKRGFLEEFLENFP